MSMTHSQINGPQINGPQINIWSAARRITLSGTAGVLMFLAGSALFTPAALAQPAAPATITQPAAGAPEVLTQDGVIAGTMDIDFGTRTKKDTSGDLKEGSSAIGAKDTYKFTFRVANTVEYSGVVTRQPNLYTKTLRRLKQEAQLFFDVNLAVFNPRDMKQKKSVGKMVGTVPIDTASGAFDLAGGSAKESALRMAIESIGKQAAFSEPFAGRLVGKAENKESLVSYTFKRVVAGKERAIVVQKSDPMRFENVRLAKGPSENYPTTTASGRLDYDYETGNWYTDGIRLRYTLDGQEMEDVITGSIKWVEDPNRESNGKGQYEFNLRFNEEKSKTATTEADAFAGMSDEDAFFAVDNSLPTLTGTITYVDSFIGGGTTPASSKVEYNLNANKLTRQQVMAFFKLWLLGVGPTNDE